MCLSALRWIAIAFMALGVLSCTKGQQAVKYQPTDKNVAAGANKEWIFDSDATGGPPAGAEVFSGNWEVRPETNAPSPPNALCQTGTAEYPAITLSNDVYTDVAVSIQFKPISGRSDQAGGIIFRVQDKSDYYIFRANSLENNVNLYKHAGGGRSVIKESKGQVPAGKWQELRVEVAGNRIRGFLDNQLVVEATDDTYKAGKIGLWTKSDSLTCFDNVVATAS